MNSGKRFEITIQKVKSGSHLSSLRSKVLVLPSRLIDNLNQWALRYSKKHSRKNLYEYLRRAIQEYGLSPDEVALNIGSGGEVQDELEAAGLSLISIDVDPGRAPDIVASATDLQMFRSESVDRVFMVEVLEHVDKPDRASSEIYRVLKRGGFLIGSTPFNLGIHDHPVDFFRFTRYGLEMIFGDFEKIEIRERNSYFESIGVMLLRQINVATRENRNRILLRFPLFMLTSWWLDILGRGFTDPNCTTGYFFVFRKP